MTAPVVPQLATDLYDEVSFTQPQDEAFGWPFLLWFGAIATAMGELPTIVRDTDTRRGWTILFDPTVCPAWALPWLAQFVGVTLTPGRTDSEHRAEIAAHAAFGRGTVAAMTAAAQATLTGSKHVGVVEQAGGDAFAVTVYTLTSETPNAAVTEAAIRSQKPAGLILTYLEVSAVEWDTTSTTWATVPGTATWDTSSDDFTI